MVTTFSAVLERTKARARAWRRHMGWSIARLGEQAGLHRNTLRGMDEPDWSPSADTLARLEQLVPADFDPAVAECRCFCPEEPSETEAA